MLTIGTLGSGVIHITFAMISVETANVASTYYINMLIGFIHYLYQQRSFCSLENQKLIEHRLNSHDERARNQAEK